MPTASDLRLIDLDDLTNPLTFRYNMATSWGISSQELTCEVPELSNEIPPALAFGRRVWTDHIANAISRTAELSFIEMVKWKTTPLPFLGASGAPSGAVFGAGSARKDTATLVLHSGHADKFSRRKFFLPGSPAAWSVDGVLTQTGLDQLYALSAAMFMGMGAGLLGGPIVWLMAFPGAVDVTPANLRGVAFRRVEWVRIHSFTSEAPDEVPLDWP